MNITGQTISAQKLAGNIWRLTVKYTATFTAEEATDKNYTFRDSVRIWEWDDVDHDAVTGWVAATNFNPASTSVSRTKVVDVHGDDLDTELGGEEIRAKISLRNFTTGGVATQKLTSIINLSP